VLTVRQALCATLLLESEVKFSFPRAALLVASALLSLVAVGAAEAQSPRAHEFPPGKFQNFDQLPPGRFRNRIESLLPNARARAVGRLKNFHFTTADLETLEIDADGGIFYADHFTTDPIGTETNASVESAAALPATPFPASLLFHSRPGAANVIFLNFSGENVTGTAWNTSLGRSVIPAVAFSTDADRSTFSDAEQTAIKRIWERVAEDYAPFDVDVTTERPATLGPRTAMALLTRSTDANGAANPSSGAGGIAYISTFATASYSQYRPAWIYCDNLSNGESYIAEAASHEVGHNLGLSHDGTDTQSYYGGHGSGLTSWGPIMGTGYNRNVSQWSKGEYYLANNTQDDLATIAAKIPYRADDHGDTAATATPLVLVGTNIASTTLDTDPVSASDANKGVIERNSDVDVFSFTTGSGVIDLKVNPWIQSAGTRGGNLDVVAELRDAAGNVLATNNPATDTAAEIRTNLSAGSYFLFIRNAGVGSPLSASPSGYTSYASIGQYFISGFVTAPSAAASAFELTVSANNAAWGTVTPASGSFAAGSAIQLVATPANYFQFMGWTNGASGSSNPRNLTLQTNLSVTALFAEISTTNHPTPLWWLASNGVSGNFETAVDSLGANGVPLWQSYLAGLNPFLPSSQLRLAISGNVLRWNSVAGRTYTLWSSTNLAGPFEVVPGALKLPSTTSSFTNTAGGSSLRFYRLQVSME
jgi:hypothetical protein